LETIKSIIKNKELRGKILYVAFILVVFRLVSHVPVPGPDPKLVKEFITGYVTQSSALGVYEILTGGGLSKFSILLMGVGPYITASIIMQLLTMVIPSLQALSKEGEQGHHKINQYSRYSTVPISIIQGYSMLKIIDNSSTSILHGTRLIGNPGVGTWALMLFAITVGTLFLMWIGELITEKGIGNGVSLIIFAGIVARLPVTVSNQIQNISISGGFTPTIFWKDIGFLVAGALAILAVVIITEGVRKIPISYAKKVRGNKIYGGMDTHLPVKINTAGVIPIIFAGAFMNLPQIIGLLSNAKTVFVANFSKWVQVVFSYGKWPYVVAYFLLIVGFTYFSTFLYFKPDEVSENVQKHGGFIPGIRPGRQTAEYLTYVLNRLTLTGSVFLGIIASMPFFLQYFTGDPGLTIGGTGLLIVVSVVLETMKKVQAQLIMRTYEK